MTTCIGDIHEHCTDTAHCECACHGLDLTRGMSWLMVLTAAAWSWAALLGMLYIGYKFIRWLFG